MHVLCLLFRGGVTAGMAESAPGPRLYPSWPFPVPGDTPGGVARRTGWLPCFTASAVQLQWPFAFASARPSFKTAAPSTLMVARQFA